MEQRKLESDSFAFPRVHGPDACPTVEVEAPHEPVAADVSPLHLNRGKS